jgi:hypothetical protein
VHSMPKRFTTPDSKGWLNLISEIDEMKLFKREFGTVLSFSRSTGLGLIEPDAAGPCITASVKNLSFKVKTRFLYQGQKLSYSVAVDTHGREEAIGLEEGQSEVRVSAAERMKKRCKKIDGMHKMPSIVSEQPEGPVKQSSPKARLPAISQRERYAMMRAQEKDQLAAKLSRKQQRALDSAQQAQQNLRTGAQLVARKGRHNAEKVMDARARLLQEKEVSTSLDFSRRSEHLQDVTELHQLKLKHESGTLKELWLRAHSHCSVHKKEHSANQPLMFQRLIWATLVSQAACTLRIGSKLLASLRLRSQRKIAAFWRAAVARIMHQERMRYIRGYIRVRDSVGWKIRSYFLKIRRRLCAGAMRRFFRTFQHVTCRAKHVISRFRHQVLKLQRWTRGFLAVREARVLVLERLWQECEPLLLVKLEPVVEALIVQEEADAAAAAQAKLSLRHHRKRLGGAANRAKQQVAVMVAMKLALAAQDSDDDGDDDTAHTGQLTAQVRPPGRVTTTTTRATTAMTAMTAPAATRA